MGEREGGHSQLCSCSQVRQWANEGVAMSSLRRGRVNTEGGSADDYRSLMRGVALGADAESGKRKMS